ncbi:MAG TPA: hypothetical protein VJZ71_20000 [Phycisphaerae bacterium]|nr:hypothetical protein [Phycisphaerae bacterium]
MSLATDERPRRLDTGIYHPKPGFEVAVTDTIDLPARVVLRWDWLKKRMIADRGIERK